MIEVNDVNFETEILQSKTLTLVDFWAPWCGPCKMIGPVVEQLAAEYGDKLKVGKLNVDDAPNTPAKFGIRGIPTIILFKGGQEVDKLVGAAPKAKLASMIDKHL